MRRLDLFDFRKEDIIVLARCIKGLNVGRHGGGGVACVRASPVVQPCHVGVARTELGVRAWGHTPGRAQPRSGYAFLQRGKVGAISDKWA